MKKIPALLLASALPIIAGSVEDDLYFFADEEPVPRHWDAGIAWEASPYLAPTYSESLYLGWNTTGGSGNLVWNVRPSFALQGYQAIPDTVSLRPQADASLEWQRLRLSASGWYAFGADETWGYQGTLLARVTQWKRGELVSGVSYDGYASDTDWMTVFAEARHFWAGEQADFGPLLGLAWEAPLEMETAKGKNSRLSTMNGSLVCTPRYQIVWGSKAGAFALVSEIGYAYVLFTASKQNSQTSYAESGLVAQARAEAYW